MQTLPQTYLTREVIWNSNISYRSMQLCLPVKFYIFHEQQSATAVKKKKKNSSEKTNQMSQYQITDLNGCLTSNILLYGVQVTEKKFYTFNQCCTVCL